MHIWFHHSVTYFSPIISSFISQQFCLLSSATGLIRAIFSSLSSKNFCSYEKINRIQLINKESIPLLLSKLQLIARNHSLLPHSVEGEKQPIYYFLRNKEQQLLRLTAEEQAVLAEKSPYFARLWKSDFTEKNLLFITLIDDHPFTLDYIQVLAKQTLEEEIDLFCLIDVACKYQIGIRYVNQLTSDVMIECLANDDLESLKEIFIFLALRNYPIKFTDKFYHAVSDWLIEDNLGDFFIRAHLLCEMVKGLKSHNLYFKFYFSKFFAFRDKHIEEIKHLPIKHLEIYADFLTFNSLKIFAEMPDLITLHLIEYGSDFFIDIDSKNYFKRLNHLTLEFGNLHEKALKLLLRCPSLKSLDLTESHITDDIIEALSHHRTLERLIIVKCPEITLHGYHFLKSFDRLNHLTVSFPGLSRQIIRELNTLRLLKNVVIEYI